jgi:galactose mutarotase-like enzyme
MKYTISNERITFISDSYNVEPWVLKFNDDEVNYFWHSAPGEKLGQAVCFPLLGYLPNNRYVLDGKEYAMECHGFASHYDYKVVRQSKDLIVYEIQDDEKTYAQYPYRFIFQVAYSVEDTSLKTEYRVINRDDREMYFSVGGHARFACPIGGSLSGLSFEDFYTEFEKPESADNIVKSSEKREHISRFFSADGQKLALDYSMMAKGCFSFHPLNSAYLILKSDKTKRSMKLSMDKVSYFQYWTIPGQPYICLEPWYGSITSLQMRPDESDWKGRKNTLHIKPGEEYRCAHYIDIA